LNIPRFEAEAVRGYTGAVNAIKRDSGLLGHHLALSDIGHFGAFVDEIVARVRADLAHAEEDAP
jgi:hypothetical protein